MIRFYLYVLTLSLVLAGSCTEKLPDRNQIPTIKAQLFRLQEAVKAQDRVLLDSVLSVQILDFNQNGDSLLAFVFGEDGRFAFEQFALGEIKYNRDQAQVECYVMDSTHQRSRPAILNFVLDDDLWLLTRFRPSTDTLDP
jgi:hypothetical protein